MRLKYPSKFLLLIIPVVGVVITGLFLLIYGSQGLKESSRLVLHGILITAGIWLGCMGIVMYLWKKFPWELSPVKHLLYEIVLITAYTMAFSYIFYITERKLWQIPKVENIGMEIVVTILITFFITSIHESVFFYRQWKHNFSKSVKLEKDNIEARYEALRAQLNPHFLFNSLNSLTTMVEDNKNAVSYIQDLSELLRYMLKSGEKELVLLRDEMLILDKYINLQQMRYPDSLAISVKVEEKYYHYALPPLALQMLVENCLKHNIISREKNLRIEIIAFKDTVTVVNNLQKKEGVNSSGQGLKNLTDRYRFFTTRKVMINETEQYFEVVLPLLQVEI